jgi:hypothetical protein
MHDIAVGIWSLIKRLWKAFEPRAEERSLKIDWRLQDKLEIYSDVELLKIIISNLLENAINQEHKRETMPVSDWVFLARLLSFWEGRSRCHRCRPTELLLRLVCPGERAR